ncbi:hypothetical protein CspeluHIS016_0501710 [Cutaneotrichosporon spelunceum]|uniref:Arrestin C-terminal-like domain-containing protein n=1 Tax=Cutaneotrichosporon spelunceum TaxID=1672016 RepID=A0AAD3TWI4_9TREE|nr:hypothetical protein CspeluHIS016_0501710 [Cutaneotrichosporon spelunceum]
MTGSNAGPVQLLLRAPPHLPFVQGYPGIAPGVGRPAATVQGTVEVRTSGAKAKWVRVEVRKHESVPSSAVGKGSGQTSTVHVSAPHLLWKPPEGKEFDTLSTADFRFCIPLPGDAPPSTELKGCKVSYELIAAVCYKAKGGLFRKDSSPIATTSAPLNIVKYELASAWPLYNQIEQRTASALNGAVHLVVDRPIQAFGPGDRIVVTATMKSEAQNVFRLKGFEMSLVEILTIHPPKPDPKKKAKAPSLPVVRRQPVCTTRVVADGLIVPHGERGARLDLVVPQDRQLLTVRGAKEFSVEYELVLEATCDGGPSKVLLGGMQCIIGTFSRSSGQSAVKEIGYVQGLCPQRPFATWCPPSIPGSVTDSSNSKGGSQDNNHIPFTGQRLSINPPYNTPSLPVQDFQQQWQAHLRQQSAPPIAYPQSDMYAHQRQQSLSQKTGFVPQGESCRRSSSSTTATNTTTVTDHGPGATMAPRPISRTGVRFPSPNPRPVSDSPFGPTLEGNESMYDHTQSEISHSNSAYGTFGPYVQNGPGAIITSSQATMMAMPNDASMTQPIARPESSNDITPTRTTPGWVVAADEKRRLHELAQDRASNTIPSVAPPDYEDTSLPKTATPVQTQPPIRDSPQSIRSLEHRRVSSTSSPSNGAAVPLIAQPLLDRTVQRYVDPSYLVQHTSQTGHSGAQYQGNQNGHISPQSTAERQDQNASPRNTQWRADEGGSSSASFAGRSSEAHVTRTPSCPTQALLQSPKVSKLYMSAAEEKDMMRQRYEDATAAVNRTVHDRASPSTQASPQAQRAQQSEAYMQDTPTVSVPVSAAYMSAAEEKDMMRKRYEAATNAVNSDTLGSSSSNARVEPPVPAAYMSAAEEKDMMRKRYEAATNAVNSDTLGSSSSNARVEPPVSAAYMSAAEEKDMMRKRYEAATNAVNSDTLGSSSSNARVEPPVPAAYMSAAEEKDMMRKRYEAATNAVNSDTLGSSSSNARVEPPVPAAYMSAAEEKDMMRKRYEAATNAVNSDTLGSSSSNARVEPPVSAAYMSAAEEKDMMRKRYEAATNAVNSDTLGSSSSNARVEPPVSAAYMSAAEEKDMMRKRYEAATNAVNSDTLGSSSSNARVEPPVSAAYMSAEQEKDIMRQRYEEATNAVNRAADSSPSQVDTSQFVQVATSPSRASSQPGPSIPVAASDDPGPRIPAAYMSAVQEKEAMRKRYEEATSGVVRVASSSTHSDQLVPYDDVIGLSMEASAGPSKSTGDMSAVDERDEEATRAADSTAGRLAFPRRSVTLRERMLMSALPDGPPPPLAPRPPREYVEMHQHRGHHG